MDLETKVRRYMWPHFDLGSSQICAKFILRLNSDVPPMCLVHGKEYSIFEPLEGKVTKATFRLLDRDFEKSFIAEGKLIAQKIWMEEYAAG